MSKPHLVLLALAALALAALAQPALSAPPTADRPAPAAACRADFKAAAAAMADPDLKQKLAPTADSLVAAEGGLDAALAKHKAALAATDKVWEVIQAKGSPKLIQRMADMRKTETTIIDALQCRKDAQGKGG